MSGTEKVPQRTFATKIFAELSGELSGAIFLKTLVLLFRKLFGAVRAIFWLWGSFWVPEFEAGIKKHHIQMVWFTKEHKEGRTIQQWSIKGIICS